MKKGRDLTFLPPLEHLVNVKHTSCRRWGYRFYTYSCNYHVASSGLWYFHCTLTWGIVLVHNTWSLVAMMEMHLARSPRARSIAHSLGLRHNSSTSIRGTRCAYPLTLVEASTSTQHPQLAPWPQKDRQTSVLTSFSAYWNIPNSFLETHYLVSQNHHFHMNKWVYPTLLVSFGFYGCFFTNFSISMKN